MPCTPTKPLWKLHCEAAVTKCPYPCGFALWQGSKGEDRLTIEFHDDRDVLWAIFDGHRNHDVAGHASKTIPGLVWKSPFWSTWPGEALRYALRECHEAARLEELTGGSTALLVLATGNHLWCCSAGDSRAVAGLRGGGVQRLSVDHTTKSPQEVARMKAGGFTLEWGLLGGVLPMTRGLGNFDLESEGFSCLPQVGTPLLRQEVDFVVLASDGLWDVISDEACCGLVREWVCELGISATDAAERLAGHARNLGSTDDIAIIVAYFLPEVELAGTVGTGAVQQQAWPNVHGSSLKQGFCCLNEDEPMACTQTLHEDEPMACTQTLHEDEPMACTQTPPRLLPPMPVCLSGPGGG